jgi:hypothetical protein
VAAREIKVIKRSQVLFIKTKGRFLKAEHLRKCPDSIYYKLKGVKESTHLEDLPLGRECPQGALFIWGHRKSFSSVLSHPGTWRPVWLRSKKAWLLFRLALST